MDINKKALAFHKKHRGKIAVSSLVDNLDVEKLTLAYSPGVSAPCLEIQKNYETIYDYTLKARTVAVISDGSAVLGLGNIGADASLPVMEGKALLFKSFANVDAFPICINTQDTEEFIKTVKLIQTSFGGINLEDISAPRCFEIEKRLIEELNIPVFHDDQHGTAIVTIAAIINSLKLLKKDISKMEVVLFGIGAAGSSIAKMLKELGIKTLYVYSQEGIVNKQNLNNFPQYVQELVNENIIQLANTNDLVKLFSKKDIFIGVSAANIVKSEMIDQMNENAICFPMANPTPEIMPEIALSSKACIVGTGRSDYPNQVNNVLAFPALFRFVLDYRITKITEKMKIQAAYAIAATIDEKDLRYDYVIPSPMDPTVVENIYQKLIQLFNNENSI